ncbi:MAG: hypothetical protein A4E71_00145 [Smithella sp. PtaU1.Bin162]|nr:MAG: hypothetical protein A4E71_00145 [Smithella sp. PtaU1.Bin162]
MPGHNFRFDRESVFDKVMQCHFHGQNGSLGVDGEIKLFLRSFKTEMGYIKSQNFRSAIKGIPDSGKFAIKLLSHADMLGALSREHKGYIHRYLSGKMLLLIMLAFLSFFENICSRSFGKLRIFFAAHCRGAAQRSAALGKPA